MKKLIFSLFILLSLPVFSTTVAQRVTEIKNAGALDAIANTSNPIDVPLFPSWKRVDVTYLLVSNDSIQVNTIALYVKDFKQQTEEAYYFLNKPSFFPAIVTPLLSGRTQPSWANLTQAQRSAQIESYSNAKWQSIHANAPAIKDFKVEAIDSSTVLVSGQFGIKDGDWTYMSVYIRLDDPNGTVNLDPANTNMHFEVKK